jgi:hypothetical protein
MNRRFIDIILLNYTLNFSEKQKMPHGVFKVWLKNFEKFILLIFLLKSQLNL